MGQKVNPIGFRLGNLKQWESIWFADKRNYSQQLIEDFKIRTYLEKRLQQAAVSKIEINRVAGNKIRIVIFTARPGIVIGRKGSEIDKLSQEIEKISGKKITIRIREVKQPDMDANLVAQKIAAQFLRRIAFRRVLKGALFKTMKEGALGVKIHVAGRLGGAEIARREWVHDGCVPLHTIRADIDYGFAESFTKYGTIGVKVWIYKGEVLDYQKFAF